MPVANQISWDVFALMTEAAAGSLSDGIAQRGGLDTILFKGGSERIVFGYDLESIPVNQQVNYKVELRGIGSFPKIWLEQVSREEVLPDTPPLYLVHRRQAEVTFRNRLRGEGEDETKTLESESELAIF